MDLSNSYSSSSLSQSSSSSSSSDMLPISPRRVSTGNAKRKDLRKQLIAALRDELGSQTWHYPPDAFVRMVSPKAPRRNKKPDECLYLDDFHCVSDRKAFKDACKAAVALLAENYRGPGSATWVTETDENAHYDQVVDFFNDILKACREALQNPTDTLFQNVTFSNMHDITMMDRAIGSDRLRPDIIMEEKDEWPAGTGDARSDRAWWCKQEAGQRQTILACEVKKDWSEMIVQLGMYARSQFDAFPSRFFVLSLAFHHIEESARFVIFHRSGFTASHLMRLSNSRDRGKFVRIFMAFMIWKDASDAGFPDFNDNVAYKLIDTTWNITQRLYHTSCIRGRATIVVRVERSDDNDHGAEFPAIPLPPRSQVHNPRKRASEDVENTSRKRKVTGARSGASNLNKIEEGAIDNSVHQLKFHIVQGNLCLPVRARTHPPSHFLQKCNNEETEDRDPPGDLRLQKQLIIKDYCPLHTRASIEKESFGSLHNEFGVANIRATYVARASNGQLQTTTIFLPRPQFAKKFHWDLFAKYTNPPEPRSRLLIEMTSIGKSFLDCKPGKDLATKVAHSMLGWFNLYQNGFLHRDVSIGNVLAFEKGEERLPFKLNEEFKASLGEVMNETLKAKVKALGFKTSTHDIFIPDAKFFSCKLEELLKENGVGTFCEAFITDGDMAKDWRVVFNNWRKEKEVAVHERSGTELFMSSDLLNPIRQNHVQSPVDDIESYLWVTLWALLTNNVEKATKEMEWCAKEFEGGRRRDALSEFRRPLFQFDARKTLIDEWATFTVNLTERYQRTIECFNQICEKKAWASEEEEAQHYKAAWHGYALEGVYKSLEIIFRNIADMDE